MREHLKFFIDGQWVPAEAPLVIVVDEILRHVQA